MFQGSFALESIEDMKKYSRGQEENEMTNEEIIDVMEQRESYRGRLTLKDGAVHYGTNNAFTADFDTDEGEDVICFSDDDGIGRCIPASYLIDIELLQ